MDILAQESGCFRRTSDYWMKKIFIKYTEFHGKYVHWNSQTAEVLASQCLAMGVEQRPLAARLNAVFCWCRLMECATQWETGIRTS